MVKKLQAYLEMTLAMIIVGANIVVGKMITVSFPIFVASEIRFLLSSPILMLILLRTEKRLPRVAGRELFIIFLQSLAGNFLYGIFLLYGLKFTSAAESGIISGTVPAIIGLISFLFLRERLGWRKSVGILLVAFGMIAINSAGASTDQGSNPLLGNLLIVGSAVGEALWTVLGKAVGAKMTPLTIAVLTSCFGLLLFCPLAIYQASSFNFAIVPLTTWLIVGYYGVVGTAGAYFFWYSGLARVSAGTAGVFTGIAPVCAVVLSYIVLREPFLWVHPVGGVCVLLAIVLMTRD